MGYTIRDSTFSNTVRDKASEASNEMEEKQEKIASGMKFCVSTVIGSNAGWVPGFGILRSSNLQQKQQSEMENICPCSRAAAAQ